MVWEKAGGSKIFLYAFSQKSLSQLCPRIRWSFMVYHYYLKIRAGFTGEISREIK